MISVTILVKNNEKKIEFVLNALKEFKEIIIIDTGCYDRTIKIVQKYPSVKIYKKEFIGFGPLHNFAVSKASYNWILSVDADEVLSTDLVNEILHLKLQSQCVYALPFKNYALNKWIRHCGWFPESHVRLYHRATTSFSNQSVHESVFSKGLKVHKLKGFVHHYPYDSVDQFLKKMRFYASLFAKAHQGKKKSSPSKALRHGIFAFIKHYFLKLGFLDSWEGLLISCIQAETTFYKYLQLYYLNKQYAYYSNVSSNRKRKTCKFLKHL